MKYIVGLLLLAGCATAPQKPPYVGYAGGMPFSVEICTDSANIAAMEKLAGDVGCYWPTSLPYALQPDNCITYTCRTKQ
jgi:hypothetical protein